MAKSGGHSRTRRVARTRVNGRQDAMQQLREILELMEETDRKLR